MFVKDPEQLIDPLPLPYRWLVSLASEIVQNVEDHIDNIRAIERRQDRERGLKIHASLILEDSLGSAYAPGISGHADGVVVMNDGKKVQVFEKTPVKFLKYPNVAPTFVFNQNAPQEFHHLPPTFVLASSANSVVLLDNSGIRSEIWTSDQEITEIHAAGIQGGIVAAVISVDTLKLLFVELPSPRISDSQVAEMWKADRDRVVPWNMPEPQVSKFTHIASFSTTKTAFDDDSGVFWFTSNDGNSLNALEFDVSFAPLQPNVVLRGVYIDPKLPTFSFTVFPMKITAIAAANYQVLLGLDSGAVAVFRRGRKIPLEPLVGHYATVDVVALVSGRGVTISSDGFVHVYDLSSGAVILRCASSFPASAVPCRGIGAVGDLFVYTTSAGYRVIDVVKAKKTCGFIHDSSVMTIGGCLFSSIDSQLRKFKAIGNLDLSSTLCEAPNLVIPAAPPSVDLNWSCIRHVKSAVARIVSEAAAEAKARTEATKAKESAGKAVKAAQLRKQGN